MAFRFTIQETFAKAIPRIARERIGSVIESLNEKPQPGAESIHDARKNLKSLRALLRLTRGSIDENTRLRENARFRDAGRVLSAIRDPQALLEALENLRKGIQSEAGPSRAKQASVKAFIEKMQAEIELTLVAELPPGLVRRIVRELRDAKHETSHFFDGVVPRPGTDWEIYVATGLTRTYRKGKNLVLQFDLMGHEKTDDSEWHELRKCAKALGYQLRLLKPIWSGMIEALVAEIDELTDRLGDANDLAILRAKILDQPYNPAEIKDSGQPRRILLQILDRRKQKLHLEALEIARLIYADKAGRFERRFAEYWRIWRSQAEPRRRKSLGIPGPKAQGHPEADRRSTAEILVLEPVTDAN